jgi:phosphotriesterase-related protein
MTTVETVRGPIAVDAPETVLMHGHVFVLDEEMRWKHPELWGEDQVVADAVEKPAALAALGVSTIVDPTGVGLGRDAARVARINAQVDIDIVLATGLYTLSDVPLLFQCHGPGTPLGGEEPMVAMFVKDLTEGIADTGVRASLLKCAIEDSPTPGVERVMRAGAPAHLDSGAPIVVHGECRVANLVRVIEKGLADPLMLSRDASCHIDWFPPGVREHIAPQWHFGYIRQHVLPAPRRAGVGEEQITTMLADNPRRFLSQGRLQ